MKCVIVFHSMCGNDHLVAKRFHDELNALGAQAGLYRVADPLWVQKPDLTIKARENLDAMRLLPEASPRVLLEADLVVMGSPTYFGNVSGQMKAFMDTTGGLWSQGALAGKRFAAFTSAGNADGGGDLCLQALHTYGKYMGMLCVPVPVDPKGGQGTAALGVIHYSGGKYAEELDARTQRVVADFCVFLAKVLN